MRFRKRIQICKGVKLNLSTSGVSATIGGRGLSFNLGKSGLFMNTSIPGTGLYNRRKLIGADKKKTAKKSAASREQEIALPSFSLQMEENGAVNVMDQKTGEEILSPALLRKIRATDEYQTEYAEIMQQYRESIEAESFQCVEIARFTDPLKTDWDQDDKYLAPSYVEGCMDGWLGGLQLPVEFNLEYEYQSDGCMMVDLDLPEIEDIPDQKAVEMADGTVKSKQKSLRELRTDYVKCVFGLAVYFAGNIFNISPYIEQVCVSGYTQRRSRTGDLQDEYVYSVKFNREGFEGVDFEQTDAVDFCMQFENRCNVSPAGEMKTIEPYGNM